MIGLLGRGLILMILFIFLAISCAGPPGPAGPAGPPGPPGPPPELPGAVIVITPVTMKLPGVTMTVFGSGFKKGKDVDIKLSGTWETFGVKLLNAPIGTGIVNEYGAFKITVAMPTVIEEFKVPPGVYTIYAEQDGVLRASAPLEITK